MPSHAALGSALAGSVWAWAPSTHQAARPVVPQPQASLPARTAIQAGRARGETSMNATAPVELPMPSALLRAMAAAAATAGRRECDVWAEAAREWLLRHSQDDDPLPPPPATAAPDPAGPRTARERCWSAIDVLLSDLRATTRPRPAMPAARGGLPCYPAA